MAFHSLRVLFNSFEKKRHEMNSFSLSSREKFLIFFFRALANIEISNEKEKRETYNGAIRDAREQKFEKKNKKLSALLRR
jgi:hypothetical protein